MEFKINYVPAIIKIKMIESPTVIQASTLWNEIDSMMKKRHCRRAFFDVRGVAPLHSPQQAKKRASSIRQDSNLLKHARLAIVYDHYRSVAEGFAEKLAAGGFDVKTFTSVSRAMSWLNQGGDQFADEAEAKLIEG